mgnify:FL=1
MILDYKRQGTVRELQRKPINAEPEHSRNFTRCGESRMIPIKNILPNPHQPRRDFDKAALQDLSISIMEYGLMQPVTVRQTGPFDYELIAGERRLTACRNLGMTYIPAIVMTASTTDSAILALVENIQRENLSYIEEAEAFCTLISEHGLTQEELADKLGKSQSTIANKIRILKLSPKVRRMLAENNLTERHARALLRLPDDRQRQKAIKLIAERGFNVAKTEELVDKLLKASAESRLAARKKHDGGRVFKDVRIFNNTIRQAVDMMRRSGIEAKANKKESDDYIEYTILIPKEAALSESNT